MSTPAQLPAAKRKQRRKITAADVEAIAELIVKRRLTETEACIHLGLNPRTWFCWKSDPRHGQNNSEALARVRAAWVESRCKSIEEVGDGANGTRRDWRAQAWMLERTLPERFGQQSERAPAPLPAIQAPTVNILVNAGYSDLPTPVAVRELPPERGPKQLTDAKPDYLDLVPRKAASPIPPAEKDKAQ